MSRSVTPRGACTALAVAASLLGASASSDGAAPKPAVARRSDGVAVRDASANAFGFPAPALSAEERRAFAVGNSFFKQNWIEAPASASARDGLGPFFHARSCAACHMKDGRSRPPEVGEANREGLILKIGVRSPHGEDRAHPRYGAQIQEESVQGVAPEARVEVSWTARPGAYADGEAYELLEPRFVLSELGYGELGEGVALGGRTAPHLVGLGLLESIPDAAILALADPDDANGDGISGQAHFVGPTDSRRLGRFGWRATQPDVRSQTAAALANDMGITSSLVPAEDLGFEQREVVRFVSGGIPEIDDWTLDRLVLYTRTLAVPEPREVDRPDVMRGRDLFASFGCVACHVPHLETGSSSFHPAWDSRPVAAYTDLLLHDMGAELADGKREGDASPSEWRTPPLWGLGLVPAVNGHERQLHDGRARGFAEAILWHGGEAEAARERFRRASKAQRADLVAFLRSI